jgi:gas vesicle protein
MNRIFSILAGATAGALFMYLFDPNDGRRRRALIRDKAVALSNDAADAITSKGQDLRNRAEGMMHDAKALIGQGRSQEQPSTQQAGDVRGL